MSRLGKIILMLGSQHDGEVISARNALLRELAGAGKDLHALAALAEQGWPAPPVIATAPPSAPAPAKQASKPLAGAHAVFEALLNQCALMVGEQEFDLGVHRYFIAKRKLSPRQKEVLADIADRYGFEWDMEL